MSGRTALLLTAHPPGGPTGSGVRGQLTLDALRRCCDRVDAVSFAFPHEAGDSDPAVALLERPPATGRLGHVLAVARGGSAFVDDRAARLDEQLRRRREAGLLAERYDVVWASPAQMARAGLAMPASRRVLDVDASNGGVARRAAKLAGPGLGHRLYHRLDAAAVGREERRRCGGFDHVVVASTRDRDCLGGVRPPVTVIPNATPPAAGAANGRDGGELLFTGGSLAYGPNVEAARFLAAQVLPRLRERRPDARLTLAGRNPAADLRTVADRNGAELIEDAPSLDPLYARASAVVAPLWQGGGTRIKVIEAMAWGLPIVATSVAVEGLALRDGESVLLAEDADGFARHCATLLDDAGAAERLGRRARETWAAHHRPEVVRDAVAELVERLCPAS